MIPSWAEINRSLYGAWRLACVDASGMSYFTVSIDGFWRSFFAAVIVMPIYFFVLALQPAAPAPQEPVNESTLWPLFVDLVSYVLGWVVFPVTMVFLARLLDVGRQYVSYIVAYNWATVLQMALFAVAATVITAVGIETALGRLLQLVVFAAVLFYQWFVARTALRTTAIIAVGIVVVDFLIGLLLNFAADSLA